MGILTGFAPFRVVNNSKSDLYRAIINSPVNLTPFDRYYDKGKLIKDFLMQALDKNPEKRWSAHELLNHEWITTMVEEEVMSKKETQVFLANLAGFKDATLFQSSVITFLVRLKSSK